MGWKTINGHRYYYRSSRDGARVRSQYVGQGEAAELFALLDAERRAMRTHRREAERVGREQEREEEREVREWFERVEAVAEAALYAAGYHRHKSQWRRRRDGEDDGGDKPGGRGLCPGEADLG